MEVDYQATNWDTFFKQSDQFQADSVSLQLHSFNAAECFLGLSIPNAKRLHVSIGQVFCTPKDIGRLTLSNVQTALQALLTSAKQLEQLSLDFKLNSEGSGKLAYSTLELSHGSLSSLVLNNVCCQLVKLNMNLEQLALSEELMSCEQSTTFVEVQSHWHGLRSLRTEVPIRLTVLRQAQAGGNQCSSQGPLQRNSEYKNGFQQFKELEINMKGSHQMARADIARLTYPSLQSIRLMGACQISHGFISHIVSHCPVLVQLRICSSHWDLTPDCFSELATMRNLQELDLIFEYSPGSRLLCLQDYKQMRSQEAQSSIQSSAKESEGTPKKYRKSGSTSTPSRLSKREVDAPSRPTSQFQNLEEVPRLQYPQLQKVGGSSSQRDTQDNCDMNIDTVGNSCDIRMADCDSKQQQGHQQGYQQQQEARNQQYGNVQSTLQGSKQDSIVSCVSLPLFGLGMKSLGKRSRKTGLQGADGEPSAFNSEAQYLGQSPRLRGPEDIEPTGPMVSAHNLGACKPHASQMQHSATKDPAAQRSGTCPEVLRIPQQDSQVQRRGSGIGRGLSSLVSKLLHKDSDGLRVARGQTNLEASRSLPGAVKAVNQPQQCSVLDVDALKAIEKDATPSGGLPRWLATIAPKLRDNTGNTVCMPLKPFADECGFDRGYLSSALTMEQIHYQEQCAAATLAAKKSQQLGEQAQNQCDTVQDRLSVDGQESGSVGECASVATGLDCCGNECDIENSEDRIQDAKAVANTLTPALSSDLNRSNDTTVVTTECGRDVSDALNGRSSREMLLDDMPIDEFCQQQAGHQEKVLSNVQHLASPTKDGMDIDGQNVQHLFSDNFFNKSMGGLPSRASDVGALRSAATDLQAAGKLGLREGLSGMNNFKYMDMQMIASANADTDNAQSNMSQRREPGLSPLLSRSTCLPAFDLESSFRELSGLAPPTQQPPVCTVSNTPLQGEPSKSEPLPGSDKPFTQFNTKDMACAQDMATVYKQQSGDYGLRRLMLSDDRSLSGRSRAAAACREGDETALRDIRESGQEGLDGSCDTANLVQLGNPGLDGSGENALAAGSLMKRYSLLRQGRMQESNRSLGYESVVNDDLSEQRLAEDTVSQWQKNVQNFSRGCEKLSNQWVVGMQKLSWCRFEFRGLPEEGSSAVKGARSGGQVDDLVWCMARQGHNQPITLQAHRMLNLLVTQGVFREQVDVRLSISCASDNTMIWGANKTAGTNVINTITPTIKRASFSDDTKLSLQAKSLFGRINAKR